MTVKTASTEAKYGKQHIAIQDMKSSFFNLISKSAMIVTRTVNEYIDYIKYQNAIPKEAVITQRSQEQINIKTSVDASFLGPSQQKSKF